MEGTSVGAAQAQQETPLAIRADPAETPIDQPVVEADQELAITDTRDAPDLAITGEKPAPKAPRQQRQATITQSLSLGQRRMLWMLTERLMMTKRSLTLT